jgi:hypothetical protein
MFYLVSFAIRIAISASLTSPGQLASTFEQAEFNRLIALIADECSSESDRDRAIASLAEHRIATDGQLELLHGAYFTDPGNTTLLDHLGRIGNEATLRLLLRQQTRISHYKWTVRVNQAIHALASRLDVDPWDQLHPLYRELWTKFDLRRPSGRVLEAGAE